MAGLGFVGYPHENKNVVLFKMVDRQKPRSLRIHGRNRIARRAPPSTVKQKYRFIDNEVSKKRLTKKQLFTDDHIGIGSLTILSMPQCTRASGEN